MCGIAGIVNGDDAISKKAIFEMSECLTHRGPDGSGIVTHDRIHFGHRRLSILDVEGSPQPMWDHERRCLITFNGEIFNFVELRSELTKLGASFSTSGDTEVILEAYKHFGTRCFSMLNGQFALGLHDARTGETFLARDAQGEKPLYYYQAGESIAFASEVKSVKKFCAALRQSLSIDLNALSDYLSLNYIPGQRTLWEGIQSVPRGHYLTVKGGLCSSPQHFLSPASLSLPDRDADWVELLRALLEDSVRLRLRSDVPVGVFLSGGIDSSLASAYAFRQSSNLTAFIGEFRNPRFNESKTAVEVCSRAAIPFELVCVEPTPESLPDVVQEIARFCDDPLGDSSAVPVYLLSQAARRKVKVVLTGDGADELFGGYLTHRATRIAAKLPVPLRRLLHQTAGLARLLPGRSSKVSVREKLERFLRAIQMPPGAAHFAWNGMFLADEKCRLLDPNLIQQMDEAQIDTFARLASQYFAKPESPRLTEILRADQDTYLPNDILRKIDRMTMAVGLEGRPVFLDSRIVALSGALPEKHLVTSRNQKRILRQLLAEVCPWYPLDRPKQGFSVPIHSWMAGPLAELFQDLLSSHSVASRKILNTDEIRGLFHQHKLGRRMLGFELWGILILMLQLYDASREV